MRLDHGPTLAGADAAAHGEVAYDGPPVVGDWSLLVDGPLVEGVDVVVVVVQVTDRVDGSVVVDPPSVTVVLRALGSGGGQSSGLVVSVLLDDELVVVGPADVEVVDEEVG
jgi:hypothetical protein